MTMSIASEISRLQSAKSCIKAAIESKGVSVDNSVKLDCYADCVGAIQTGGGSTYSGIEADFLLVGGGGSGGAGMCYGCGGGGGGGEVLLGCNRTFKKMSYPITIGAGGEKNDNGYNNGCPTTGFGFTVLGGGGGGRGQGRGNGYVGGSGGNGGGAGGDGTTYCPSKYTTMGCPGLACGYYSGYNGVSKTSGGYNGTGGGGAGGMGSGVTGGPGITSSITGTSIEYGAGGASCSGYYTVTGYGHGGNGRYAGFNSFCGGSPGCPGIVVFSYKPQTGYSTSGGNCCYTCNGRCIHIFTSDGTLTIS